MSVKCFIALTIGFLDDSNYVVFFLSLVGVRTRNLRGFFHRTVDDTVISDHLEAIFSVSTRG